MSAVLPLPAARALRQRAHWTDRIAHAALLLVVLALVVFLALPLAAILAKSLQDSDGAFVGLANFIAYVADAGAAAVALEQRLGLGAGHADHGAARLRLRLRADAQLHAGQGRCSARIALIPLLAPSLLSAISLIYWFGNQGVAQGLHARRFGFENDLRRAGHRHRRVLRGVPACADDPGHRARRSPTRGSTKRPTRWAPATRRKFFTITLPGAKYGLISAALVTFTLVMTDFGIPKVIGGNFNVLATDVFKLVIGQQDFQRGAVVGLLLLTPAVLTFVVDWLVQRKQTAMLTARAVPYCAEAARAASTRDDRLLRR